MNSGAAPPECKPCKALMLWHFFNALPCFPVKGWKEFLQPVPCPSHGQRLTTGLHTHELQLDALDGRLGALHHQLPRQGLRDHTVGGIQVPSDQEFGKGGSLKRLEGGEDATVRAD